jgi:multicomponent Na+:H+ antiporter subunit F
MITETGIVVSALLVAAASYRVIDGPRVEDRVVALDTISTNVVALAVLYAVHIGKAFFINVALMLAITGFIATVSTSMYIRDGDIIR